MSTTFSFDDDTAAEDFEGIFEQNHDTGSSNTNSASTGSGGGGGSCTSFSSLTEDSTSRVDALTSGLSETTVLMMHRRWRKGAVIYAKAINNSV